jgi:hypothetical protein
MQTLRGRDHFHLLDEINSLYLKKSITKMLQLCMNAEK